jgi:hypothetical protein
MSILKNIVDKFIHFNDYGYRPADFLRNYFFRLERAFVRFR